MLSMQLCAGVYEDIPIPVIDCCSWYPLQCSLRAAVVVQL